MPKKMKALVKKYEKPGIWMEEVDVPEIKDDEVLVKMHYTSICGTDIHIYEWNEWAQQTIPVPMIVGHEYVGEVVEVGKNVTRVKKGEIVTGEGHVVCGECKNCRGSQQYLCPNTEGIGVNRPGIFAEFAAIPATNIIHTTDDIDEKLYSVFDPFGNAVHTALSYDLVGKDVLVTGAGPIGIMAAAVAQHVGARKVILTDLLPYRIELAKKMGVEHVYNTSEISIEDIRKEHNMEYGFDIGMEMSGSSIAFNDMVDNMIMGGKIAMLAVQPPGNDVDWNKIVFGGITIKGIYGRIMYQTWQQMQALLESGFDLSPIVTHVLPIDDFDEGFETMSSGDSGKIILDWEA